MSDISRRKVPVLERAFFIRAILETNDDARLSQTTRLNLSIALEQCASAIALNPIIQSFVKRLCVSLSENSQPNATPVPSILEIKEISKVLDQRGLKQALSCIKEYNYNNTIPVKNFQSQGGDTCVFSLPSKHRD